MVEKIKVTVNFTVYEILDRDMYEFGNRKPSGKVNVNEFLCNVAIKMYRERVKERNKYTETFNKILQDEDIVDEVVTATLSLKDENNDKYSKGSRSESFIIYTNKVNAQEINEIIINGAGKQNVTTSEYFRGLYTEYANKTKVEREKTHFRELIDKINEIGRKRTLVSFDYKWMSATIAPYCAFEDFNYNSIYMYGFELDTENPVAFKINQIQNLIEMDQKHVLSEDAHENFLDKFCSGYLDNTDELINVEFTLNDLGFLRYMETKDLYKYNLELEFTTSIHEDTQTKHKVITTEQFFFDYFISYGKNINIISPLSLKERFNNFYKDSIE